MRHLHVRLVLLGIMCLLMAWGAACSCGDIEAPSCTVIDESTHPDWVEIQKKANENSSSAGESVNACLHVAWGDASPPIAMNATTTLVKYFKERLVVVNAKGEWVSPALALPASADGKTFRFQVFFFPLTLSTEDAKTVCEVTMRQDPEFKCLENNNCLAGYEFRPERSPGPTYEIARTIGKDQCHLSLRPQELPLEGGSEGEVEPIVGEVTPELPDSVEPAPRPEPPDAGPDEVTPEPVSEPISEPGDAGPEPPLDGPDVGPGEPIGDGGVCKEPPPLPDQVVIDAGATVSSAWRVHGGGDLENGVNRGGVVVHRQTGNIYVAGQVNLSLPLTGKLPTFSSPAPSLTGSFPGSSSFLGKVTAAGTWRAFATVEGGPITDTSAVAVDQRPLQKPGDPIPVYIAGTCSPTSGSTGVHFALNIGLEMLQGQDSYVARVNDSGVASRPLQYAWAARVVGAGDEEITSIGMDPFGNLVVVGVATNAKNSTTIQLTFEHADKKPLTTKSPGLITANVGYFLAKIDPNGKWLWARWIYHKKFPSSTPSLTSNGYLSEPRLAVTHDNHIWVGGSFVSIFEGHTVVGNDVAAFVARYKPNYDTTGCVEEGHTISTYVTISTPNKDTRIGGLAIDKQGAAYVGGTCKGAMTARLFPGSTSTTQPCGLNNLFVAKVVPPLPSVATSMQFIAVSKTTDQTRGEFTEVRGLAVDTGGNNVYVTGLLADSPTLDNAGTSVQNHKPTTLSGMGMFALKLHYSGTAWAWEWSIFGGRDISTTMKPDQVVRGLGVALGRTDDPIFFGRMAPMATFFNLGAATTTAPPSSLFVVQVPNKGPLP